MNIFDKIYRFFAEKAEKDFLASSTVEDGVLVKYEGTSRWVVIPEGITAVGDYAF